MSSKDQVEELNVEEEDCVEIDTVECSYESASSSCYNSQQNTNSAEESLVQNSSSTSHYSDLIGTWNVHITTLGKSYTLTIYKQNGVYYADGISGRQTLRKERNKFYDVDGSFGEYYQVIGKQLKICDQDGWLDYFETTYIE